MKIELSDGQWATLRSRKTVSEREKRQIDRAFVPMIAATRKLREGLPFSDEDEDGEPITLTEDQQIANSEVSVANFMTLTEKEHDDLEAYVPLVTSTMVEEWSFTYSDGSPLLISPETVLSLPTDDYAVLSKAALKEWNSKPDATADGAIDPKAGTAS